MAQWPKEHEDLLRQLWSQGLTGTEIAKQLEELPRAAPPCRPITGITRNMVLGKVRRLGLTRGTAAPA